MLPTHKNEKPTSSLKVLCFTFKNLSPRAEFFLCCGLVFLFYLIYGYLAELIFTLEGVSGWYITLLQFLLYTFFGLFENAGRDRNVPLKIYFLLAFLTLGTMVSADKKILRNATNLHRLLPGPLEFCTRTSQLSNSNNLQKL